MNRTTTTSLRCSAAAALAAGLAVGIAGSHPSRAQAAPQLPAVEVHGVRWEGSLAAAQDRARRAGRPVLLLSMFGRLDEEFC